jgi:phage terminase large subunit-like protein
MTDALRLRLRPHDVQRAFLTSTDQTRLFVGGLGSGKTFAGWVAALMLPPDAGLGLIMAPTYPMIRDVLIASLETHFRPFVSDINKTEHRVTFVNGMTCLLRSATDPDKMRGINAGWGWAEEACFIGHDAMTVWASRIRVGAERKWVTTTPIKGSYVHRVYVERGQPCGLFTCPSEANPHLSASYIAEQRALMSAKEQARELDAQWVDADGVLFDADDIGGARVDTAPHTIQRWIIGVDPAVTSKRRSDRTGIIVVGVGRNGHAYVTADLSGQYAPHEWARVVCDLWRERRAEGCLVVCETNQGGDLVERNLRAHDPEVAYVGVHAAKSKADRAQPVATQYRLRRVHHVGVLRALESQMTTWEPTDAESPDRLDALVWALTEADPRDIQGGTIAAPSPPPPRRIRT